MSADPRIRRTQIVVAIVVLWLQGAPLAVAQSLPSANTQFEVDSVKPNVSGDSRVAIGMQPGGRYVATNVSLRVLIMAAYRLQLFQVTGGPGWVDSERFDISAKASSVATPEQVSVMLRTLLTERFGLITHTESRDLSIFELVREHTDRLGPGLKAATTDCEALRREARERAPGQAPPSNSLGNCGMRVGAGTVTATGMPLSELIRLLAINSGRTVRDETGLEGQFDFSLTWLQNRR